MTDRHRMVEFLQAAGLRVETWYRVRVDVDDRHTKVLGTFQTEREAQQAGKGAGCYGGDGSVDPVVVLVDTRADIRCGYALSTVECVVLGSLREQALAKLTPEERKALGL